MAVQSGRPDHLNMTTLYSSKGREFSAVIALGLDQGRLPRAKASEEETREAIRLLYVGITRAKLEVHLLFNESYPSPLVGELERQLGSEG